MWKSNTSKKLFSVKAGHLKLPPLFHISFNSELEGIWAPKLPDGSDAEPKEEVPDEEKFPYPEPSIARISVSSSIEGCFIGVYPNVAKFFEEKNYPEIYFAVYAPVFKGPELVVTNKILTQDRVVWDAVVTDEYCILSPVYMSKIGMIKVENTNKAATRMIHPFGDPKLPKESVGPDVVDWKWEQGPTTPFIRNKAVTTNSFSQFR